MILAIILSALFVMFVAAFLIVTWQFRTRWQGSKENRSDTRNPHQRWPEILHWEPGDKFEELPYGLTPTGTARLISLTEDGKAYCWDSAIFTEHKTVLPINRLIGCNASLRDRNIDEQLKASNEYMDLIKQFTIAYRELQKRDK